jgi:hypothetical protein
MTGRNYIMLNGASMSEALEEYLKKRMPEVPLKVEEVLSDHSDGFKVTFLVDETKKK